MVGNAGTYDAMTDAVGSFSLFCIPSGNYNVYAGAWGSVSYTHLRAHETVLDLVCRLLLEKKKIDCTHSDNRQRQSPTYDYQHTDDTVHIRYVR